jgi:hypothetical protein
MKIYLLLLVFCLTMGFEIRSQSDTSVTTKRNAVYVELLGNAGLYSFNYERQIARQRNNYFNLRLGAAYLWWAEARTPVIVIEPIYLRGKNNHFLELGLGLTARNRISSFDPELNPPKKIRTNLALRIGYRYQPKNKNWLFRFGLTPIGFNEGRFVVSRGLFNSYLLVPGLSFGKQF